MKIRYLVCALVLAGCGGAGTGDLGGGPTDMGSTVGPHFSSLMSDYLSNCASCHTPAAPGRTQSTEKTLDFSSTATAYQTITGGMAAGLVGNQMACNRVPFVAAGMPGASLLVAVLDQPTRAAFSLTAFPSCDASAISDETVKVGSPPSAAFLTALKQWISAGAPND